MAFSEARRRGFSPGTPVSSPPSSANGFSQFNKAEINAVSTLSTLITELSLRTKLQTAGCTSQALDVLHGICTRLRPGHLSVRVGDSSLRSE